MLTQTSLQPHKAPLKSTVVYGSLRRNLLGVPCSADGANAEPKHLWCKCGCLTGCREIFGVSCWFGRGFRVFPRRLRLSGLKAQGLHRRVITNAIARRPQLAGRGANE